MSTPIRIAGAGDVGVIEEIVQAAYGPWVEIIGVRPLPLTADYPSLVAAGLVHVLDPLDGLIVLVPEEDALLVENVAVRPSAQGRGLGRRLLAYAEESARSLGLPAIRLYTNEKMTSNLALYTSLGYQETDRKDVGGGRHAVFMRLSLVDP